MDFDFREMVTRLLKYLIEGAVVGLVAALIPSKPLSFEEALVIALVAAATFSILDMVAPTLGAGVRQGASFGLGANLIGFPMMGR